MAPKGIDELTRQAIKRAYTNGEGSYPELAARFKVSLSSVRRICNGIKPAPHRPDPKLAQEVVVDAIAAGAPVTIGGIDINQYLANGIQEMSADMKGARVATKEGMAGVLLRWIEYYAKSNPPTLEQAIEQLLAREDFDPQLFDHILSEHVQKAS